VSDQFKALILNQNGESFTREVKSIEKSFLKHGDVTVKVEYSGLNYKDALILKNLSDRQISIDQKLIEFIIKRIDRTYGKISDFIYKIDEISLKRKKPIDFKIIKEALEV